jgi:hypothetical protein
MAMELWSMEHVAGLLGYPLVGSAALVQHCEACQVVPVKDGDKYCDQCANDIAQWLYAAYWDQLAEEYMEALRIQEGWY